MKKLWSIFTEDMDTCYFTGRKDVERHHIFGAHNRNRSEEYGYVIPLSACLHTNGASVDNDMIQIMTNCKDIKELDTMLKKACERHYIKALIDKDDVSEQEAINQWIEEFGRNYLD